MEYEVNGQRLAYTPETPGVKGEDRVLLDEAIDLTSNTTWHDIGFSVEKLFSEDELKVFRQRVDILIRDRWKKGGLDFPNELSLDQYHTRISSYEQHIRCIDQTKLLLTTQIPFGIDFFEDRISQLLNVPLIAKNPFDGQSIFHFRVVRPGQKDNNPLHRDVWLDDYDSCINLYIPIAGSSAKSSLILIPGSHRWPESKIEKTVGGAVINGVRFNVPAVTKIIGDYTCVRPDPKENEVLIFSPYLIHGGAVNLNDNTTRISIEMRLWVR